MGVHGPPVRKAINAGASFSIHRVPLPSSFTPQPSPHIALEAAHRFPLSSTTRYAPTLYIPQWLAPAPNQTTPLLLAPAQRETASAAPTSASALLGEWVGSNRRGHELRVCLSAMHACMHALGYSLCSHPPIPNRTPFLTLRHTTAPRRITPEWIACLHSNATVASSSRTHSLSC
ncbi:hypothetical protein IE81DRAFT_236956 [Ceraceosorus guamensis]|uniref:Uncharacterized protein n=1 Tax=Ceraceosorus guamensis TaxID=1522189 RepID=A0A316VRE6_9BASI|nr:hypothetical protein IE81DRAFT_236956 [Ceraceosorus guamensis]PWN40177.1 hypothetical protein IE81DRAFT_236956 [Ceraceosorus guamensis]